MSSGPGYEYQDLLLRMGPTMCWALDSQFGARDLSSPPLNAGTGFNGVDIGGFAASPDRGAPTRRCTDFDGVDDAILASGFVPFSNAAPFAFTTWAWRDTSGSYDVFFSGNSAASFPSFHLVTGTSDVAFEPQAGVGNTWVGAWPGNGQWVHVFLGFDPTAAAANNRLYINGSLVSTKDQATDFTASPGDFLLGAQFFFANPFDGKMAFPAVFARLPKPAEVLALWKAGAGGSGSGGDGLPGLRWA